MTVKSGWVMMSRIRGAANQVLLVLLINVPSVSFGLALGWVSLASGEAAGNGDEAGRSAVIAAVTTFTATILGVPLSARALRAGRKFALIATSACFVLCWGLKLASWWGGGACVVAARVAAGLGGAAAWALSPLLAREMCSERYRGAAVSALALAHNAGVLLMYLAADAAIPHWTVLWWCLGLSVVHCFGFTFVPESPSFLAAKGKTKEARSALAWFRGVSESDPALEHELKTLPPPDDTYQSAYSLAKEMLSDKQRRRAFIIGAIAVIGQEACGVLAILQYAERVFVLARDEDRPAHDAVTTTYIDKISENISTIFSTESTLSAHNFSIPTISSPDLTILKSAAHNFTTPMMPSPGLSVTSASGMLSPASPVMANATAAVELITPARHAVILGVVQLVAAALSLYLVERVGRRPLLVTCAVVTGGALAAAAGLAGTGAGGAGAAAAVAVAVAADSAGLQPAPYAVLADMFHYQYRGCALMLASAGACAGNALEVGVFPAAAAAGGLRAAFALAAALTLAYALFAACAVPETRGRTPQEIYDAICPRAADCESADCGTKCSKETVCTSL